MAGDVKETNLYEKNQRFGSFSSVSKSKIIKLCMLYDCTQANLYNTMNTDMCMTGFGREITEIRQIGYVSVMNIASNACQ